MKTLAIIGGGAAGLAAAVAAGERFRARGIEANVVVYEADERVGRSILATGNGRCNFSNALIDASVYRNADYVREALFALKVGDEERVCTMCSPRAIDPTLNPVHEFFADHGLEWREEAEGRLYPLANKASVVLDVLRAAATRCGVREECTCCVVRVEPPREKGGRFTLVTDEGVRYRADAVVVSCGGRAVREMLPEAFAYRPPRPVLGPIRTQAAAKEQARELKALDNVRVRCAVSLLRKEAECGGRDQGNDGLTPSTPRENEKAAGQKGGMREVAREEGELLFRSYGVSGIAVFNLSRFAQRGDVLSIDLLPQVNGGYMQAHLLKRYDRMKRHLGGALTCADYLRGLLLAQVAHAVLKRMGLREDEPCNRNDVAKFAAMLKGFELVVDGIGEARQCQVQSGGFDVDDFDAHSMESCAVPGLYAAGEMLDVDAPCGGYNLHWAWASGMLAGRSAANALMADVLTTDAPMVGNAPVLVSNVLPAGKSAKTPGGKSC